jgi:hypothetical protein
MKLETTEPQELGMKAPGGDETQNLKKQKMNCDWNGN